MMNEVLGAIRLVKMYAWEESFRERIGKVQQKHLARRRDTRRRYTLQHFQIRSKEMQKLKQAAFLQSISLSITPTITFMGSVATLLALT